MAKYSKPVWQMVKEAVSDLGEATPNDVIDFLNRKYPDENINERTIRAHMIGCSVNHTSAHHYNMKHKFLFTPEKGIYRIYDPNIDKDLVSLTKKRSTSIQSEKVHKTPRVSVVKRMNQRIDKLVNNFDDYINYFDEGDIFTGPSWYFHLETINHLKNKENLSEIFEDRLFFQYIYATLTSWGMHRMGPSGAKLVDFEKMYQSIKTQKDNILIFERKSIFDIKENTLEETTDLLWNIIDNMKVSASRTKLVANSKALHHIIPGMMPPIDRQYTINFFYNNKTISGKDEEIFKKIYPQFYNIASISQDQITKLVNIKSFHTSETKVIDNAIVGFGLKELK